MTNLLDKVTVVEEDEAHHPHGGSSLERQESCPASYRAEEGYPNEDSEASIRGRKLHKACEDGNFDDISDEDKDQCIWAKEAVIEICSEYKIIEAYKEYRVFINNVINSEQINYGTADVLLLVEDVDGNRKVVIIDYKFGFTPVNVFSNIQLESYGVGACQRYKVRECDYWIIQPALNYCKMDSFTDVTAPYERVLGVIAKTEVDNPVFNPTKSGCRFCKHRLDCEARQETQHSLMITSSSDISTMTPSEVADTLDKIEVVEGMMKDMKKQATEYVKENGANGRYKVMSVNGRAKSITVEDAYRIAPEHLIRKHATIAKGVLEKAYVEANYVKGTNTKKALKDAFKTKITPLVKYNNNSEKLIKL